MNASSSNALLKTLEEPGEGIHLILLAHNVSKLLPTIVSRCRHFRIAPMETKDVIQILKTERPKLSTTELENFATLSGGSPGEAMKKVDDGKDILPLITDFLANKTSQNHITAASLAETIGVKKKVPLALDILLSCLAAEAKSNPTLETAEAYRIVQQKLDEMTVYNISPALTLETALKATLN